MKKLFLAIFASLALGVFTASAQTTPPAGIETKRLSFRASKDQVTQAQKMLKAKNLYAGEATGKYDDALRDAIKSFQKDNGLRATGSLNRATLEKMDVELTEAQRAIPASPGSFAAADDQSGEPKKRGPVFRASREQIMQAQRTLKEKGMYAGGETGRLDDATRDGLRKFQTASGARVTGTLNRETLERLNITLTEKQKAM